MFVPLCSFIPLPLDIWDVSDSGCHSLGRRTSHILENNHSGGDCTGKTVLLVFVVWGDQFCI